MSKAKTIDIPKGSDRPLTPAEIEKYKKLADEYYKKIPHSTKIKGANS